MGVLRLSRFHFAVNSERSLFLASSLFVRGNRNSVFLGEQIDLDQNLHINPVEQKSAIRRHKFNAARVSEERTLRVSILGVPNSGKSTLANALTGFCARPVSTKVHTTRFNAQAVLNHSNIQICITDTPGVVNKEEANKYKLQDSLVNHPELSGVDTDLFLVLQDISNRFVRESISPEVLRILCLYPDTPSILVLNKLDTVPTSKRIYNLIRKLSLDSLKGEKSNTRTFKSKDQIINKYFQPEVNSSPETDGRIVIKGYSGLLNLLNSETNPLQKRALINDLVQDLKGWPGFHDVFTVSALKGTGIEKLRNYLLESSKTGRHRFPAEIKTDLDSRQLVKDVVKSKLLDILPYDIPYLLNPEIDFWKVENEVLRIGVAVDSPHPRITKQILRKQRLREIAKQAECNLQNFFETDVFVSINVRVLHGKKDTPENSLDDTSDHIFL